MKARALTILELIVSMAIAMLVTAAVVVNMNVISRKRLEMTGRTLAADLVWARQQAISAKEDYIIDFNLTLNAYSIYNGSVNAANLRRSRSLDVDLVNITVRTGISSTSNLSPAQIRFDASRGAAKNSANNVLNLVGIKLGTEGREVMIGVFGETGNVDFRDYIPPGCFVATAAYAGRDCSRSNYRAAQALAALRQFRDRRLLAGEWGAATVRWYYQLGPQIARLVEPHAWMRRAARVSLDPLVWLARLDARRARP